MLTYSAVKRKTARRRASPLGGRRLKLAAGASTQEKTEEEVFLEDRGQPGQACAR